MRNAIQMALKLLFFSKKNPNIHPAAAPRPPSVIRLDKTNLLATSPYLDSFENLFNFRFKSFFFFCKTQVTCQPRPRLLILHSTVPLFRNSPSFRKILISSLRVICGLASPPNKKSWLRLCTLSIFLLTLTTLN